MDDENRSALFGAGGGGGEPRAKTRRGGASGVSQAPIFALDKEDHWRVQGLRTASVRLVAAGGGTTVVVTADGHIVRMGADRGDEPELIELRAPGAAASTSGGSKQDIGRVHGIWVDPTGSHTLISTVTSGAGCLFHCDRARTAAREIVAVRGQLVESVAWNYARPGDETRLGPALLGTSSGRILSLRIADRKDSVGKLWELPDGENLPIKSLRLEVLSSVGNSDTGRFYCMAVTARPLRYYTFSGGPTIEGMFASASAKPITFNEIRGGVDSVSSPHLCFALGGSLCSGVAGAKAAAGNSGSSSSTSVAKAKGDKPDSFAMLTGVGLFLGRLVPAGKDGAPLAAAPGGGASGSGAASGGIAIVDPLMVGYPTTAPGPNAGGNTIDGADVSATPSAPSVPLGFAVTDYHILLLFKHRLLALSRVSLGVVWEAQLNEEKYGTMRGIATDVTVASGGYGGGPGASGAQGNTDGSAVWIWSDKAVYQLGVTREERDVWRLFLGKQDFDSATLFCKNDPSRRELIAEAQADSLFASGKVVKAAAVYARTRRPFEELCLKFINAGARPALKKYLLQRLSMLGPQDKLQRTILATWLCEQYLDELNALQTPAALNGGVAEATYTALLAEFRQFLKDEAPPPVTSSGASSSTSGSSGKDTPTGSAGGSVATGSSGGLDAATTLSLMSGHGRIDELLFFCALIKDYDRIVSHYIGRGQYAEAIGAICNIPRAEWAVGRPSAAAQAQARKRRAAAAKAAAAKAGKGGANSGASGAEQPIIGEDGPVSELWYRYGALLLTAEPELTVAAWRDAGELLNPVRLIPAMVRYEQARAASMAGGNACGLGGPQLAMAPDAALVYCEWIIRGGRRGHTSRALHNLLLSLYAGQPAEDLLLAYVIDQTADMEAISLPSIVGAAGAVGGGGGTLALFGASSGAPDVTSGGAGDGALFMLPGLMGDGVDDAGEGGEGEEDDKAGDGGSLDGDGANGDAAASPVAAKGPRKPLFDLPFALRVCLAAGRCRACVRLYTAMGLYTEALELALSVDISLAKDTANAPPREQRDLRKRLWTRIAAWAVAHSAGSPARDALSILHASDGLLRVEDVLGYFPSSTLIDDFKEEVSRSLAECDSTIGELKREMRDFHAAAERIRGDIRALRNRCGVVRVGQRCELCATPVLGGGAAAALPSAAGGGGGGGGSAGTPFYLFSCSHAFHRDCLMAEMTRHLNKVQKRRVDALMSDISRVTSALYSLGDADSAPSGGAGGGKGSGKRKAQTAVVSGAAGGLDAQAVASLLALTSLEAASALATGSTSELTSALVSRREDLQAELDRYIAAECLHCGDVMIDSVAEPLGPTERLAAPGLRRGSGGHQADLLDGDDDWEI